MNRRAVSVDLVLASVLSTAAVITAVPAPALACGMPEMPVTGSAKDRLTLAEKDMKDGRYGQAYRVARTLFDLEGATDSEKAEGHAIAGWVLMHNGAKEGAAKELAAAKKLDAGVFKTVLASAKDEKVNAAVKKAIEA